MNLQQFRFVRETIRCDFNLTRAARSLYTSQPGVSKAIIELESELGVQIFERHGKRIRGLTLPGKHVARVIERIMVEIDNLKRVSDDFAHHDEGNLVIACTHAQARYLLPGVIPAFRKRFPKVRVSLAEGSPPTLAEMVLRDEADLAIATETLNTTPGLVTLPVYDWEHVLVVKPDHPLTALSSSEARHIDLDTIARYPIITYDHAFSGRRTIDSVADDKDVTLDIVLSAIDADIIKTYVGVGLGVGIIAGMAFDPRRDKGLAGIPLGHLFGTHTTRVGVKSNVFLRDYVYEFISMLAADLTRETVAAAVMNGAAA
ncbi:MAG TPA: CysB family HTH-type transcriptional regulator [Burkholderiaceae bacterium]|nr:CysB family HTH-type transcriptional regulator [Burkholderiaceae bacterium]